MFYRRRNLFAWIFLLLAAVCWTLSRQQILGAEPSFTYPTDNTSAPLGSSVFVHPTDPDGQTATSRPIPPSVAATGPAVAEEAEDNRGKAWGIALGFMAVMLAVAGVFVVRQDKPLLGPDGAALVLAFVGLVKRDLLAGDFAVDIWLYGLFTLGVLATLREVWGWLRSRFILCWCAGHRLAAKCGKPQQTLLLYAAWIGAAAAGLCILCGRFGLEFYLLSYGGVLACGLLGCACLWQYGVQLHHLRVQLEHFRDGSQIQVGPGAFEDEERQLLSIQTAHAEAVRTAALSERFRVDLIANVSHDLRTPLTSILGYGELLQKQALSPEGAEQLARLNRKAGYMRDLVDSLFELTKVSSGAVEAKRETIDLIRLLEQTLGLFDDQLTAADLAVKRHYGTDSLSVVTDGARMHQVFANLLGNAVKYALPGTRVHLYVEEDPNAVTVRMANTASYEMDFSPEEIMQRFARGDKARTTGGSGLGLAIAQTYTESVGGGFRVAVDGDQFSAIVTLPKTESKS